MLNVIDINALRSLVSEGLILWTEHLALRLRERGIKHADVITCVKNVPALVCDQCGEVYFEDDIIKSLEAIIDRLEGIIKEVAIVDFADVA